jgi:hypothetical protein
LDNLCLLFINAHQIIIKDKQEKYIHNHNVTITLSREKQGTQIRSSTIIDHEIYYIKNPDNQCGDTTFMAINNLISINTRYQLLHVILTQKVLFSNKREFVSNTQNLL